MDSATRPSADRPARRRTAAAGPARWPPAAGPRRWRTTGVEPRVVGRRPPGRPTRADGRGRRRRATTTAGRVARRSMASASSRSGSPSASTTTSGRPVPAELLVGVAGGQRPGRTPARRAAWGPWPEGTVCPAWVAVLGVPNRAAQRSAAWRPGRRRPGGLGPRALTGRPDGPAPRAAPRSGAGACGPWPRPSPGTRPASAGRWRSTRWRSMAARARLGGPAPPRGRQLRRVRPGCCRRRRLAGGQPGPPRDWELVAGLARAGRARWRAGDWARVAAAVAEAGGRRAGRRGPSGSGCRWPGWGSGGPGHRRPVGRGGDRRDHGRRLGRRPPDRRDARPTWWWPT